MKNMNNNEIDNKIKEIINWIGVIDIMTMKIKNIYNQIDNLIQYDNKLKNILNDEIKYMLMFNNSNIEITKKINNAIYSKLTNNQNYNNYYETTNYYENMIKHISNVCNFLNNSPNFKIWMMNNNLNDFQRNLRNYFNNILNIHNNMFMNNSNFNNNFDMQMNNLNMVGIPTNNLNVNNNMGMPTNNLNMNNNNMLMNEIMGRLKFIIESRSTKFMKNLESLDDDDDELGNNYFEAEQIRIENDNITSKIETKVTGLPKYKKEIEFETEGNFLYRIGGIARESLEISNQINKNLSCEYKKYLYNRDKYLKYTKQDDKDFSAWVKKQLLGDKKNLFKTYSEGNRGKIEKYLQNLNQDDKKFLVELFEDFIGLYLKCALSFPFVEVNFYIGGGENFDNKIMTDFLIKGKETKINFCYLPQLKSNGSLIRGGKYYVFTYYGDTYRKKDIDYNNVKQIKIEFN